MSKNKKKDNVVSRNNIVDQQEGQVFEQQSTDQPIGEDGLTEKEKADLAKLQAKKERQRLEREERKVKATKLKEELQRRKDESDNNQTVKK